MLKCKFDIKNYIGKEVSCLNIIRFMSSDIDKAIGISLNLNDGSVLSARLDDDGVGFILDNEPPELIDMGRFGRTEISSSIIGAKQLHMPNKITGINLEYIDAPGPEGRKECLVFTLDFPPYLAIINDDDELIIDIV